MKCSSIYDLSGQVSLRLKTGPLKKDNDIQKFKNRISSLIPGLSNALPESASAVLDERFTRELEYVLLAPQGFRSVSCQGATRASV